jgi:hypothetical protein
VGLWTHLSVGSVPRVTPRDPTPIPLCPALGAHFDVSRNFEAGERVSGVGASDFGLASLSWNPLPTREGRGDVSQYSVNLNEMKEYAHEDGALS